MKKMSKKYYRDWYAAHPEYRERQIKLKRERKARHVKFIKAELAKRGKCIRCGNNDLRVLEWHHRDRKTKRGELSSSLIHTLSIATIVREIEKCDVVCANCHRIITVHERKDHRTPSNSAARQRI